MPLDSGLCNWCIKIAFWRKISLVKHFFTCIWESIYHFDFIIHVYIYIHIYLTYIYILHIHIFVCDIHRFDSHIYVYSWTYMFKTLLHIYIYLYIYIHNKTCFHTYWHIYIPISFFFFHFWNLQGFLYGCWLYLRYATRGSISNGAPWHARYEPSESRGWWRWVKVAWWLGDLEKWWERKTILGGHISDSPYFLSSFEFSGNDTMLPRRQFTVPTRHRQLRM